MSNKEQQLKEDTRVTKSVYILYDTLAENISMIGIYDTDKIACRSFTDFLFVRRYNYKDFKVYSVCDVNVRDIDFSPNTLKEVTLFSDVCSKVFGQL